MSNKDYYNILNIDKNASDEDIKKAYKKLALQYHPDKNQGNEDSCEKFKEIGEAYGVLSNKDKKSQYDMMGSVDDTFGGVEDPFAVFNDIFRSHINNFMNMKYENDINLGNIFSNMSGMPEKSFPFGNIHVRVHTFTDDLYNNSSNDAYNDAYNGAYNDPRRIDDEDFGEDSEEDNRFVKPNLGNIFNNLFNKGNKIHSEEKTKTKIKTVLIYNKPDSIIYNITVSFSDIYNMKKKKINIMRKRRKDGIYIEKKKKIEIPIYGREILLECEGHEMKDYKERGDIIINIFNKNDDNFKRVNEYDMVTNKEITINDLYSDFLYYDLILPHGEILKVKAEKMLLDQYLIQKIKGKGLPYEDNGILKEGNLYILYVIKFPKNIEDLKLIEKSDYKECNEENYISAYNSNIYELFETNI
jgi:DnaJ-class molecular chaperone